MASRSSSDWHFGARMQIRPDRQTLLWSATWPKDVQAIARDFLKDPYQASADRTTPCTPAASVILTCCMLHKA